MAQVDTSIYGNLLRPPKSVVEYDAERMQAQQGQQQNQLAGMMIAKEQRGIDSENALSAAYSGAMGADGTMDRNKLYSSVAQAGQGAKLPAIQKGFADQDKSTLEASKASIEMAMKKQQVIAQHAGAAVDQSSWDRAIAAVGQMGIDVSQIPRQFDPAMAKTLLTQSLSGSEQLAQHWKQVEAKMNADKFGYQQKHDTEVLGVQVRGQDKTAASAAVGHRLKAEENGINRSGIVVKRTQDVEMKLQDDYRMESKGWSETSTSMKKILGAITTADKNPGSALAAGTAFMKILDPNSVVRESELGMALNASGWFDRATNIAQTMQIGKVMTPTQQKNLREASENLFEEAKSAQREVDAAYKKRAVDYGADPERVIVNRGQNNPRVPAAPVKPPAAPAGGYSDAEKEKRFQAYKASQK